MNWNMDRPDDKQIECFLAGVARPEEARIVMEWLTTKAGRVFLTELMDTDFEQIKPGTEDLYVGHAISSGNIFIRIKQSIRKKRLRRVLFRVAAVLLPFLILASLYLQVDSRVDLFGDTEYEEVHVPKGERIQILFQDGTKVYINSDSYLKYPKKFGLFKREIYFRGEAYFHVSSNKNRPFIVNLDGPSIQVLGTEFNVKAYPDNFKITACLDKGSINFALPSHLKYRLKPGERLEYDRNTDKCTIQKASNARLASKWTQNIIAFKDAPLAEVVQTLNRWYGVNFTIMDEKAKKYSYTLTSENTLIEKVLKDLEKISPLRFHYVEEKKEVTVHMKNSFMRNQSGISGKE